MKPAWWLLYAIWLLMGGLLALVEMFVPSGGLRSILQIAVVIMSFGLMARWVRHNRVVMELEEYRRRRGMVWHRPLVPTLPSTKPAGQNASPVASPLRPEIIGRATFTRHLQSQRVTAIRSR
jgi:hypothetical protein